MLMPKGYKSRLIDKKIKRYLNIFGALCIEGPKWCGKTWTSLNNSKSAFFVGNPEENFRNRFIAETQIYEIFKGEQPRLIDEWQEVPAIWGAVRYEVDKTIGSGKFILTGSSTPKRKGILHSGVGRIDTIKMYPMSLYESGDSEGTISLLELFDGDFKFRTTRDIFLKDLIGFIIKGGWPECLNKTIEESSEIPKSYIKNVISSDISRVDGIERDKIKVKNLLHSLARNEGTTATTNTITNDINANSENLSIYRETVAEYIEVLERLFVLENHPDLALIIGRNLECHKLLK